MGSQKIRHDLATEQQKQQSVPLSSVLFYLFIFLRFHIEVISSVFTHSFRLVSLIIKLSISIHVVRSGKISFFVWLNNIPLCVHIHIYIYIYTHTWIYTHTHISTSHLFYLFIPWTRHRWFPCLVMLNNAAVNTGMYISSQVSAFAVFE